MRKTTPMRAAVMAATLLASGATLAVDGTDFTFETTEDLYQICSAQGQGEGAVEARLACRAFLEATVQYHDAVSDRKKMKRLVCYPKGATIADARNAFVAWGKDHAGDAKRMGEIPVVGLVRALANAYPCK